MNDAFIISPSLTEALSLIYNLTVDIKEAFESLSERGGLQQDDWRPLANYIKIPCYVAYPLFKDFTGLHRRDRQFAVVDMPIIQLAGYWPLINEGHRAYLSTGDIFEIHGVQSDSQHAFTKLRVQKTKTG